MFNSTISKSVWQGAHLATVVMFGLLSSGCTMADTISANPPTGDHVKVVAAADAKADIAVLHDEVTKYLRDKYTIQSGNYFRFSKDVPWVAISKNVENQMAEKSIERVFFEWNNPGYDFVDVYPQGNTAFAVAMNSKSGPGKPKLVGYFVLAAKK
jgi:hypothetical protein